MDLAGFEPAAFCLPNRRATCCATGPLSGTPESNGVSPAPKADGLPSPSCPIARRMVNAGLMPSAVEVSTADPAGRGREKQGRQDSNLRRAGLEAAALTVLSYTPMSSCRCLGTRNAARSRSRVGGVCASSWLRYQRHRPCLFSCSSIARR